MTFPIVSVWVRLVAGLVDVIETLGGESCSTLTRALLSS